MSGNLVISQSFWLSVKKLSFLIFSEVICVYNIFLNAYGLNYSMHVLHAVLKHVPS